MRNHRKKEEHAAWKKTHYDAADRNDKLIINLRDLSHIMRSLYEGRGSQRRILIILDEIGSSITQRELTERLGIQPGSVSEVIAKLEAAAYIRRVPSETDRRTTNVELTETGKTVAARAREERLLRHEQMFCCLSDEEKDQLLSLLERVNEDWEKRYPDAEDSRQRCGHSQRAHGHHKDAHRCGEV